MTTLHALHDVATVFASAFGIVLMFAALVLAAPFATTLALLCAAGVFKSHGGVGPRKAGPEYRTAARLNWEYGVAGPDGDTPARRHTKRGNVQFVLWKAGEQGHTADYWHNFDPYWWPTFQRSNRERTTDMKTKTGLKRALPKCEDLGDTAAIKMLFGNSSGVFEALAAALERDAARARRRRVRRLRWIQLRRALREAMRSRLAAITAGVWIAVAIIRVLEESRHA